VYPTYDYSLDYAGNLDVLRGQVKNSWKLFGISLEGIAAETGLNLKTLENIADGTTQLPRDHTTYRIKRVFASRHHIYLKRTALPLEEKRLLRVEVEASSHQNLRPRRTTQNWRPPRYVPPARMLRLSREARRAR
jgi:hypothetical protein